MAKSEDTAKLRSLGTESLNGTDDTDSLPILPDAGMKSPWRAAETTRRTSDAGGTDTLDRLIDTTAALDQRLHRIEKALTRIQTLITELQKERIFGALTRGKSG